MKPEELKKIALEATKKEYEAILSEMEKAATSGSFTCNFQNISDGAQHQLREAGYEIERKTNYNTQRPSKYYQVRFGK